MRIALNVEQLFLPTPGGTGRYIANLAPALSSQFPIDSLVLFSGYHSKSRVRSVLEPLGISASSLRLPLPGPTLYEAWHRFNTPPLALRSALRKADLIHAPSPAIPPSGGKPLVATLFDATWELFPKTQSRRSQVWHRRGAIRVAQRARIVLTASESAADDLARYAGIVPDVIRVVPLGADQTLAREEDITKSRRSVGLNDGPYLFWVGTLEPRKNLAILIQAFRQLVREDGIPHTLVLSGPSGWGENHSVMSRSAEEARIMLTGPIDDLTLRGLYAGADLLAFPSLYEGFGLPTIEAMVQGTPVVCSDIPSLREVTGGVARLVDARSVQAWVDALRETLGSPHQRSVMSRAGRAWASRYSWERTAAMTRAAYEEAL